MNKIALQRARAKGIKKMYPPGTRIELISMNDPYAPVPSETRGTVMAVDDMGTLHMKWDNGRTLGVVPGEDDFRRISQLEIEAEQMAAAKKEEQSSAENLNDAGGIKMTM